MIRLALSGVVRISRFAYVAIRGPATARCGVHQTGCWRGVMPSSTAEKKNPPLRALRPLRFDKDAPNFRHRPYNPDAAR